MTPAPSPTVVQLMWSQALEAML